MARTLLVNLFVVLLVALWLSHSRRQDLEDAGVVTQNLTKILEQYVVGTVRTIDLTLLTAVDEYEKQIAGRGLDEQAVNGFLALHRSRMPEIESLRVADAQGTVRYGPGVVPGVNIADRDFFTGPRDDPQAGLVISRPLLARISKKWVITFSRRLNRPDGSFAGVVYVNLALEKLGSTFAAIDVGPHGSVTLRDRELGVVVRYPEPQGVGSTVGNKNVARELREMVEAGVAAGNFTAHSGTDDIQRVFSYRKVGAYPYYVIVGLATEDIFAEWYSEIAKMAVLTFLFSLVTLLSARLMFAAWKRQVAIAEALKQQETKFHALADHTYDWEYWQGADQREILYMTPSCERITGYTAAEFAAAPDLLLRIVHPDDLPAMEKHAGRYAERTELAMDFRIRRRDGETRWIAHACRPVYEPNGQFLGRRVSNRDITERQRVEEALREAEARFRSSFDASAIGMALVSPEGRFVEVNPALCEIVGYAPDELKQKTFQEITYPDDLEVDLAYVGKLGADDITSYRMEKRYFHKDGHIVWILLTGSTVRNEQGGLLYFVAQIQDITERRQAEDALKKSERRLREAQRVAQIGSWDLDFATQTMTCSEETCRIFEFDAQGGAVAHTAFIEAIHSEDRERVAFAFAESTRNRRPFELVYRLLPADGSVKYVRARSEAVYDDAGNPVSAAGTVQDVTLQVLTEESIRESEERFRTIADYTYDWEYWQGPQGEFLYISPSCQRVTGYAQADFISNPNLVYDVILAEDRHLMDTHLQDIRHEDEGSLDFRIVTKEGEIRWIAHGCRAVFAKDGRFIGRRASNRDITDRKHAEAQVEQLAYYDTLTNLPNRRMLFDRLSQALSQAKRFGRSLAIMFLDLDNFKKVNDTLGHEAGDELLREVAARLATCVRSGDTVSRQGGDEFVIVLAEIAESMDAARVAEKVIEALTEPVRVAGQELPVTTSIGIAVYPVNGADDIRELLKKADKAMYAAKAAGRNGYRFFSD